ncbi:MAG TPA: putative baseplate assembly protein [Pyrinomonadaceae bacterium]|nr:putative baseplate assembly protein [Pyrinomonadaceae bacterium]
MIVRPSVTVDGRDQDALVQELEARRAGYVPEWRPVPRDPGRALELIAARYAQAVLQRLAQSPEKNKLAFLDMLGQQLSPARASRAPIVFQLTDGVAASAAPAGTSVAAPPPPGSNQQVVFETERDAGLTGGKLAQVFSLWPGRDEYVDHSADFQAGLPVKLFDRDLLTTTPHHLYLAHPVLLNLSGNVELSVEFQLLQTAAKTLEIVWEYWDGQVWRGFASLDSDCQTGASGFKGGPPEDPNDGTNGLTTSGVVKLKADCAKSDKTSVNGVSNYWIRGRLGEPLPPDPAKPLPDVESIRVSSLASQPLVGRLTNKFVQPARIEQPTGFGGLTFVVGTFVIGTEGVVDPPLTGIVMNEAGQPLPGTTVVISDPKNPDFGERRSSTDKDGKFQIASDDIEPNQSLRFEVTLFDARAAIEITLPSKSAAVELTLKLSALALNKAYNDGTKLDTTKPFYPFGQQPQPGTVFYFNNKEIFSKPGARFRMYLPRTSAPSDNLKTANATAGSVHDLTHLVVWEYWNGREWTELMNFSLQGAKSDFTTTEILDFRVPVDLVEVEVNKDVDLWMRARLVSGGYGFYQEMKFQTGTGADNNFTVLVTQPPILAAAVLGYSWQFGPFHPEAVLTFNDFHYQDHTYEATWPGSSFLPYQRVQDVTATLYLGFDQKPPTASIGIFFDVVERATGAAIANFVWEYWDGFSWSNVAVEDETTQLTAPGILSFIAAADSTALDRFGTGLHWLRARLKEDGPPAEVTLNGIYPNAVWALQQRTFTDVALGTATGQPSEVFRITQIPVIPPERLEVLELSGARANVEWRLVALELSGGDNERVRRLEAQLGKEALEGDLVDGDLRLRRDKQKRVAEVWVRWYSQPNLFFSGPTDRHYAIDRARGLVFFGDGVNGRTLPLDAAVNVRRFQSGGGSDGNVAARAITQLLGAVSGVQSVFNPRAAEGGSDGETLEAFRLRAPASVRHRGRALTVGDYEAMVREASSAVSVVKAVPNRNPAGRILPGWVTLFIIPGSQEPRPYPSRGLRDEVHDYIAARAPAGLAAAGRLYVTGPSYFPVDISATIVPVKDSEAGPVETRARAALEKFLHPLRGGPSGEGWDFGRGVYLSDVATVLESIEGLDYAELIQLLVSDEVRGDFADVPRDQIVVAGTIRLKVKGARS